MRERDPLEKAIEVLRWLVDSPPGSWGVREIARGLGRPPTTVHRALASLEAQSLVVGDPETGRYELGLEFYRIALRAASRFSLVEVAYPALQRLQQDFNETAFLATHDANRLEMLMAATVESTQALRYVVTLNEWSPLYLGASGLAIFAHIPAAARKVVLARLPAELPVKTRGTVVPTVDSVCKAVDRVHRDGYARTLGERVPDAVGIAAAIFDSAGVVVGSLGVTLPSSRYERERGIEESVMAAASEVAGGLAGQGNAQGRTNRRTAATAEETA